MPSRQGLIPVKHTITHPVTGKEFSRTYHERPEVVKNAVREAMSEEDHVVQLQKWKAVIKGTFGADADEAEALTSRKAGWAFNTGTPGAIRFRAAAAMLATDGNVEQAREMTMRDLNRNPIVPEGPETQAQVESGLTQTHTLDAVRAMAFASQSQYDTDTVTLYRGVTGEQARALRKAKDDAKDLGGSDVEIEFGTGVVSSWSDRRAKASSFGEMVVKVQVPRESIVLSHKAVPTLYGPGGDIEGEVVILTSGSLKVKAFDVTSSSGY